MLKWCNSFYLFYDLDFFVCYIRVVNIKLKQIRLIESIGVFTSPKSNTNVSSFIEIVIDIKIIETCFYLCVLIDSKRF